MAARNSTTSYEVDPVGMRNLLIDSKEKLASEWIKDILQISSSVSECSNEFSGFRSQEQLETSTYNTYHFILVHSDPLLSQTLAEIL